ncbi:putative transcription factor [Emericellopsis atlantica]|uniref:Transcription factor n=1 Tax=Emericellopsis atlantica TaxID=2614577 RepID=A0A9P7ZL56_9HYPO|nr:putative transcription factor [Emericellopsis atlantica]KAG9254134.1 putative transcription factor [Emericellopsis atlantica]
MSRQPRSHGAAPTAASRQNEYFVPRDGIDREVISADVCRYLGNDALVRPGHYEDPQTGQVVQGYYITAYRNLTTAMIEDLKADSARWDNERRAQTSRNTAGGIFTSRSASGVPARSTSNSPIVQYRMSETHHSRQYHGPTEGPVQQDPYARESALNGPRYPGTGTPGYTGAAGGYQQQPGYAPPSGGGYGGYQQPPSQSPQPDPRYGNSYQPAPSSGMDRGFSNAQDNQSPYIHTGSNMTSRGYPPNDGYSGQRLPSSSGAPQQPIYASAPPSQTGYTTTSPYQQYPQHASGNQPYQSMHPAEAAAYGRGK